VPQLFERYCTLSRNECHDLSLICRIPILKEKETFKVKLFGNGCRRDGNQQLWADEKGDELWTHLYAPMKAEQMMSNSMACETLVKWLQCWPSSNHKPSVAKKIHQERTVFMRKELVSGGTRGNVKEHNMGHKVSYCYSDEEEGIEEEEFPMVAILHGNHGTGKTAAVYACAAEAGLEVSLLT